MPHTNQRILISIYTILFLFILPNTSSTSCYDNCSNHGTCINYHCKCIPGYIGENCAVELSQHALPILSVGTITLTSRNFTSFIRKTPLVLVGFSSHACARCITAETEYQTALSQLSIPLARIDADRERSIVEDFPQLTLPALYLCGKNLPRGGKCIHYDQVHESTSILAFVQRLSSPIVTTYAHNSAQVETFIQQCIGNTMENNLDSVVLGFFDIEEQEDEIEEYREAAINSLPIGRIHFGQILKPMMIDHFKQLKWYKRSPAVVVHRCQQKINKIKQNEKRKKKDQDIKHRSTLILDEYYGSNMPSLTSWIQSSSLPIVGELKPSNFAIYEALNLPMLIAFINIDAPTKRQSGLWTTSRMKNILNAVASKYFKKITVVYTNGVLYKDKMKTLGILNGIDSLPALAMNTMGDGNPVVPLLLEPKMTEKENSLITDISNIIVPTSDYEYTSIIIQYCEQYLSGRLKLWKGDNIKSNAKSRSKSSTSRSISRSKSGFKANPLRKGVQEHFHLKDDVVEVYGNSFDQLVLEETTDVVLLLHAEDGTCTSCEYLTPYYKKFASRMKALQIQSVVVARMDVSITPPPPHIDITSLPVIVLYRAYSKNPPYIYFSGVAKVRPMMDWIQKHAGKSFTYGDKELPQFDSENAALFKRQIKAREDARVRRDNIEDL